MRGLCPASRLAYPGAAAKAADDLAAAYADAKRRINAAYEAHINAILADYPLSETLSFEKAGERSPRLAGG